MASRSKRVKHTTAKPDPANAVRENLTYARAAEPWSPPEATEVAASPAPAEVPAPPGVYRVGTWAGLPNYECLACPFKSPDLKAMEEHYATRHGPQPPAPALPSSLVDPSGRPLPLPPSGTKET